MPPLDLLRMGIEEKTTGELEAGSRIEAFSPDDFLALSERHDQSPQDMQHSWHPGVVKQRGHGTFDDGIREDGIPAEHVRSEGSRDGHAIPASEQNGMEAAKDTPAADDPERKLSLHAVETLVAFLEFRRPHPADAHADPD